MKDSVKILNRSVGKLVTHDNNSMIEYGVSMKVNVIYPCEKDIYTCKSIILRKWELSDT
jgi:hypothetical protein